MRVTPVLIFDVLVIVSFPITEKGWHVLSWMKSCIMGVGAFYGLLMFSRLMSSWSSSMTTYVYQTWFTMSREVHCPMTKVSCLIASR